MPPYGGCAPKLVQGPSLSLDGSEVCGRDHQSSYVGAEDEGWEAQDSVLEGPKEMKTRVVSATRPYINPNDFAHIYGDKQSEGEGAGGQLW